MIDGGTPVLQRYGVSDDDAFAVGLTCGGIIDSSWSRSPARPSREFGEVAASVDARASRSRVATVLSGPGRVGARRVDLAGPRLRLARRRTRLDDAVDDDARGMLAQGADRASGATARRASGAWTTWRCSCSSFAPPPRMLVFGAIDFAAAVARVGKFLGYHVTVCDARPVFATRQALPRGRRGGREVAARLPGRRSRGGRAHGDLRAHPRPEVRRAAAGGGAAHRRPATSARWARAAPTRTGWPGCARRA